MSPDVILQRRTLHRSDALLVEDSSLPFARALGRSYSARIKLAFTYFGAFFWRVGTFERLIDANTILRVNADEEFFEAHPVPRMGHASVIFTPSPELLDELRWSARDVSAPVTSLMSERIRLRVHDLLANRSTELKQDEIAIDVLAEALRTKEGGARRTIRLVERAKEILHQNLERPVSLPWIAGQLGVTPVHLTQTFRRQEGVPLYRYQTRLRLNRALWLLVRRNCITEVAFELGYSSHAHFTAAFTAAFGVTPSAYRG